VLRFLVKRLVSKTIKRLFTDPYDQNLAEGILAVLRTGPIRVIENEIRSSELGPLLKPIGTQRKFPHFDGLLFNSAQLSRRAIDDQMDIDLTTVIGKRAQRPMAISMPILISGMGYGVGVSKSYSRAMAKGSALVETAYNTGQGPVLPFHRELAHRLVVQWHGAALWRPDGSVLPSVDMVEIRFGQGANAGQGSMLKGPFTRELLVDLNIWPEQPDTIWIPAGVPELHKSSDLRRLVKTLRKQSRGAPIAVKLAASHSLERDLELVTRAGADVIVLDGAQGGTIGSPSILVDDFGLPTLSALCRAVKFLKQRNLQNRMDLIVSGGIHSPGDMLKALALGATAVYIGTPALFATTHTQITKAIPFEPPTQLAWSTGLLKRKFNEEEGAHSLAVFLANCADEMRIGVRALGRTRLQDMNPGDLVAYDPDVARITGVPLI